MKRWIRLFPVLWLLGVLVLTAPPTARAQDGNCRWPTSATMYATLFREYEIPEDVESIGIETARYPEVWWDADNCDFSFMSFWVANPESAEMVTFFVFRLDNEVIVSPPFADGSNMAHHLLEGAVTAEGLAIATNYSDGTVNAFSVNPEGDLTVETTYHDASLIQSAQYLDAVTSDDPTVGYMTVALHLPAALPPPSLGSEDYDDWLAEQRATSYSFADNGWSCVTDGDNCTLQFLSVTQWYDTEIEETYEMFAYPSDGGWKLSNIITLENDVLVHHTKIVETARSGWIIRTCGWSQRQQNWVHDQYRLWESGSLIRTTSDDTTPC